MTRTRERQLSKRDGILIAQIVERALGIARQIHHRPGRINLFIGLALAHKHMPMDLDMLLHGDDVTLAHDVFGIMRHIDPDTGQLRDCFVPRTARFQHEGVT